jgi:hypothetical protein
MTIPVKTEWVDELLALRRTVIKSGALAFARSVIKCGEPWTETCHEVIDGALDQAKGMISEMAKKVARKRQEADNPAPCMKWL